MVGDRTRTDRLSRRIAAVAVAAGLSAAWGAVWSAPARALEPATHAASDATTDAHTDLSPHVEAPAEPVADVRDAPSPEARLDLATESTLPAGDLASGEELTANILSAAQRADAARAALADAEARLRALPLALEASTHDVTALVRAAGRAATRPDARADAAPDATAALAPGDAAKADAGALEAARAGDRTAPARPASLTPSGRVPGGPEALTPAIDRAGRGAATLRRIEGPKLAGLDAAAAPALAAPAAASPSEIEAALRERLLEPGGLRADIALGSKDREAVATFYAAREHRPLWIETDATRPAAAGAFNEAGRSLLRALWRAGDDGLDARRLGLLRLAEDAKRSEGASTPAARAAELELGLSLAAVAYARDARGARVDPRSISRLVTARLALPEAGDALLAVSTATDAGAALQGFNPPHAGYRALRAELARLRSGAVAPAGLPAAAPRASFAEVTPPALPTLPEVADGPLLRIGGTDARVPALRARLGLPAVDGEAALVLDSSLSDALRTFQRSNALIPSGELNRQTVAFLRAGARAATARTGAAGGEVSAGAATGAGTVVAADLIANMERWRWLPADLGERHVFVNVPEFQVRIVQRGQVAHQARVIVGKPETPTPIFSDAMDHVVVNPSWHIPPSIMKNEILPGLARDPDYASRRGYEVIRRGDQVVGVRQPPGERNALGFIKFMFPNEHAVYLHDTPNRSLFGQSRRALSHGCVRVDQPFRLVEHVLGEEGWNEGRMRALIGRGERTVRIARPIPVHLAYFTAWADASGRIATAPDLYGHHRRVRQALAVTERRLVAAR